MSFNTIIQQGRFTADGTAQTIQIRSDVDWMAVYNYTAADGNTNGDGVQYYWQRGMTAGTGLIYYHPAGDQTMAIDAMASAGFTLIDSSAQTIGGNVAVTNGTNATQPVYSTGSTTGLATGAVVRLNNLTGQEQLAGIDFEIDNVIANTSFRVRYVLDSAPGAAATAGNYRIVNFDPIYYPRRRYIVNITNAASAVVTLSVTHGYTVGQEVRFVVSDEFEMTEMNGLSGTITAVNTTTNTITVDIDSSAFTAFDIPEASQSPLTWAQVVPLGEDTGTAISNSVDILGDTTDNTAFIGMTLGVGAAGTGTNGPAGANNDVVYWVAGKSFSVTNE